MKNRLFVVLVMLLSMIVTAFGQESDDKYAVAGKLMEEGVALHDKQKYEDAIKKYDEALKLLPYHANLIYEKAYSLAAMGKRDDAKKLLEKLFKKENAEGNLTPAYMMYANYLDEDGEQLKALDCYEKALDNLSETQNSQWTQKIFYNMALTLSHLTDENKKKVENWEGRLYGCCDMSLRIHPYHSNTLLVLGDLMTDIGHYINALCCYSVAALATEGAAEDINPRLLSWKDKSLTPESGPRTTNSFNKVQEILRKEPSEYGLLYDVLMGALPLACPDTLRSPVPVSYAGKDIFEDSYCPFFAEVQRRGLLEFFCHQAAKVAKEKHITNADWISMHKSEEEKYNQLFRESLVFATGIEDGFVPDSVDFTTPEEAHLKNSFAMGCCQYYLNHTLSADNMDYAAKYITQWSMLSPDVTIKIGDSEAVFLKKPELLVAYVAGCSFSALQSGEGSSTDIYGSGIIAALNCYIENKEAMGTIEELDKLVELFKNDEEGAKKYVEENYNK